MAQSLHDLLLAYLPLVVFIAVAAGIGIALLLSAFLLAYKKPDPEKLSAYECGFNAFDDARMKFDVRFYLVAILFIIFDLEVSFLFPWAVAFGKLGNQCDRLECRRLCLTNIVTYRRSMSKQAGVCPEGYRPFGVSEGEVGI